MPEGLARAMVTMLMDWRPAVDVIVVADSVRRPELVADLASGLSRFLRKPVVGRWAVLDESVPPDRGATNAARRVAAVSRRSGLRLDEPDAVRGRRVLLVDDLSVTGWTLTLAGSSLHDAGADAVLPLVLGVGT